MNLIHLPGKPAGFVLEVPVRLAVNLIHLPDEPAGVCPSPRQTNPDALSKTLCRVQHSRPAAPLVKNEKLFMVRSTS
jgi:hypothetical protein